MKPTTGKKEWFDDDSFWQELYGFLFPGQPTWSYKTSGSLKTGQVYNSVFRLMSRFVLGHTHTMDIYLYALGKTTGRKLRLTITVAERRTVTGWLYAALPLSTFPVNRRIHV